MPCAAVGGAAGLELLDGLGDLLGAGRRVSGKDQARGAGVDDDGHVVLLRQLVRQHPMPAWRSGSLLRIVHRAGDVEQEDEVARRKLAARRSSRPCRPMQDEPMLGLPRARRRSRMVTEKGASGGASG